MHRWGTMQLIQSILKIMIYGITQKKEKEKKIGRMICDFSNCLDYVELD